MLTVVIKDNGEENVVKLTYENIWKEIKDIPGAELLVDSHWGIKGSSKNRYICFLEADCLVNSGYFTSLMGLIKKNPKFRKLAMMTSATGVNNWGNKFYGYCIGNNYADGIVPVREKKSSAVYPVQIGYLPGAVARKSMLEAALKKLDLQTGIEEDLVKMSTMVSLEFWRQGDGNPVFIAPNSTYVTTEDYVNEIAKFDSKAGDLALMFARESI